MLESRTFELFAHATITPNGSAESTPIRVAPGSTIRASFTLINSSGAIQILLDGQGSNADDNWTDISTDVVGTIGTTQLSLVTGVAYTRYRLRARDLGGSTSIAAADCVVSKDKSAALEVAGPGTQVGGPLGISPGPAMPDDESVVAKLVEDSRRAVALIEEMASGRIGPIQESRQAREWMVERRGQAAGDVIAQVEATVASLYEARAAGARVEELDRIARAGNQAVEMTMRTTEGEFQLVVSAKGRGAQAIVLGQPNSVSPWLEGTAQGLLSGLEASLADILEPVRRVVKAARKLIDATRLAQAPGDDIRLVRTKARDAIQGIFDLKSEALRIILVGRVMLGKELKERLAALEAIRKGAEEFLEVPALTPEGARIVVLAVLRMMDEELQRPAGHSVKIYPKPIKGDPKDNTTVNADYRIFQRSNQYQKFTATFDFPLDCPWTEVQGHGLLSVDVVSLPGNRRAETCGPIGIDQREELRPGSSYVIKSFEVGFGDCPECTIVALVLTRDFMCVDSRLNSHHIYYTHTVLLHRQAP